MFESGKKGYAAKKAYEIAYALFRISAKIAESGVKDRLELQAMDLLISANAEEYGNAAKIIAAIDALVKFSVDLNMISIANGDILLREIAVMNDAIIECLDQSDEVDASKFFSVSSAPISRGFSKEKTRTQNFVIPAQAGTQDIRPSKHVSMFSRSRIPEKPFSVVSADTSVAPATSSVVPAASFVVPAQAGTQEKTVPDPSVVVPEEGRPVLPSFPMTSESGNPTSVIKSGNRKIAILDKIRQSGNCKLREIQEILPDCSERTIRYDLEELIERNLVERIGSGGPAVSYKIRQFV